MNPKFYKQTHKIPVNELEIVTRPTAPGRELKSTNGCLEDVETGRRWSQRRAALERTEGPLWVGSGSSRRALELALSSIKLTFTWQGSLGPQQTISVAVPQRAISVVVSNQKHWRR
jgi:hypothetical protein